jgi:hypothetical protein
LNSTVILKLVCAVVIAGEVLRAGSLVEVTESEAKDLLRRGKAEPHSHDPESGETVTSSGTNERDLHPAIAAHQEDRDSQAAERDGEHAAGDAEPVTEAKAKANKAK